MSDPSRLDYMRDAWALLAHFGGEPGGARVSEILGGAEQQKVTLGISIINVGEIAYITERERGLAKTYKILAVIQSLPIAILPADEKLVLAAAHLKANHRLSYADAFAAASAQMWQATLLTGDPEFKSLARGEIQVEWLSKN